MSGFKSFLITFLVAALVFGTVAYFITGFLTDTITGIFDAESSELDHILIPSQTTDPNETTGSPDTTEPPPIQLNGESFNMLLIVTDHQPDLFDDYFPTKEELDQMASLPSTPQTGLLGKDYRHIRAASILLLRVDKERQEFTYTVFPAITEVDTPSGTHMLGDIYHLYGWEHIRDAITAMTGLPIDYHLLLNITDLYEVVNLLGGFTVNVPTDLYYNGTTSTAQMPDSNSLIFLPLLYRMGENYVDGTGAMALTMWEEYTSAAALDKRNTLLSDMLHAILWRLAEMSEAEFTAFYDTLFVEGLITSSFTVKDMVSNIDLFYAMRLGTFRTKTVNYPGNFSAGTEKNAVFTPDTDKGIALFKNYRKISVSQTAS